MDEGLKMVLGLVVRHGLTTIAGVLGTLGVLQSSQTAQFITTGSAIVVGLAGVAMSWWEKKGHQAMAAELNRLRTPTAVPPRKSA
jgi:hypothetical protein